MNEMCISRLSSGEFRIKIARENGEQCVKLT